MKILILDNNKSDIKSLKKIIINYDIGIASELKEDMDILHEIEVLNPEVIILDWVYEDFGCIHILKEIKRKKANTKFIMISKEFSKEIIEDVYKNGADFFIHKPINEYEVESILNKIKKELLLEEKIKKIHEIFNDVDSILLQKMGINNCEQDVKLILLKLGIISEQGSYYIIEAVKYLKESQIDINDISTRELCSRLSPNPKGTEQKIRRAINAAMTNLASLGIEDYMNETFIEYASTLFSFEQVKREMDNIRKKTNDKGSINVKKFLLGLSIVCEKNNN